jgi:hypothetical protein
VALTVLREEKRLCAASKSHQEEISYGEIRESSGKIGPQRNASQKTWHVAFRQERQRWTGQKPEASYRYRPLRGSKKGG